MKHYPPPFSPIKTFFNQFLCLLIKRERERVIGRERRVISKLRKLPRVVYAYVCVCVCV